MTEQEGEGEPLEETHATAQHLAICSLENFALVTQLPLDYLKQLGFTQTYLSGQKAIRIVCRSEDGSPGATLFQTGLEGEERYQWRSGNRPMPYGLENLQKARDQGRVFLTRHISDALALRRIGLPALALLDAHSGLDQLTERLRGIHALYLLTIEVQSVAISQWLTRSGLSQSARILTLPGGATDLTAVYRKAPDRFLAAINRAMDGAVT